MGSPAAPSTCREARVEARAARPGRRLPARWRTALSKPAGALVEAARAPVSVWVAAPSPSTSSAAAPSPADRSRPPTRMPSGRGARSRRTRALDRTSTSAAPARPRSHPATSAGSGSSRVGCRRRVGVRAERTPHVNAEAARTCRRRPARWRAGPPSGVGAPPLSTAVHAAPAWRRRQGTPRAEPRSPHAAPPPTPEPVVAGRDHRGRTITQRKATRSAGASSGRGEYRRERSPTCLNARVVRLVAETATEVPRSGPHGNGAPVATRARRGEGAGDDGQGHDTQHRPNTAPAGAGGTSTAPADTGARRHGNQRRPPQPKRRSASAGNGAANHAVPPTASRGFTRLPPSWGRVDHGRHGLCAHRDRRTCRRLVAGRGPSEGLAHYARRFDDMRTEVELSADAYRLRCGDPEARAE